MQNKNRNREVEIWIKYCDDCIRSKIGNNNNSKAKKNKTSG
jgi:hypothetical protein